MTPHRHRFLRRDPRAWFLVGCGALLGFTWPIARADGSEALPGGSAEARAGLEGLVSADAGAREAAWNALRAIDATDRPGLLRELVLFAATAPNERAALAGGAVIDEFDVPALEVVRAVVPLLESGNDGVRAQAANVLGAYEQLGVDRPADFSLYREIIEDRVRTGEAQPAGLVAHLFATDPGQALLTMMRAHGIREPARLKEILWAEHTIADAVWQQQFGFIAAREVPSSAATELARMASDEAWWARLYAVEIMRWHPGFRTDALVKALQADADARVRTTAVTIPATDSP